jgi:hypothetical protein
MKQYVDRKELLFAKKELELKEVLKDSFFKSLVYEISIIDKK